MSWASITSLEAVFHFRKLKSQLPRNVFMKKNVVLFVCFLLSSICQAQDKKVELNLDRYETILENLYLGDHGFIFKLGTPDIMGKSESKFQYYDVSCSLLWEKKIKDEYGANGKRYLVSSPEGDVVYNVEMKGEVYKDKTQYITQILKTGEIKNFEISGKEEFGKNLQAVFCDKQYLYYLTTEEGWEQNDKKKEKEKLILNRFSNDKLSHQKFYIDLPPITDGDHTTFWSFIGQKKGGNYLLSKTVDVDNNIVKFNIVVVNEEGKILKKANIDLTPEGAYLRPAYTILHPRGGSETVANMDNSIVQKVTRTPHGVGGDFTSTRTIPVTTIGAFSNLMLDPEQDFFYAYGLFGPERYKRLGPVYEGFYLYKYDLEGNFLWKLNQTGSEALLDEKVFKVHAATGERDINLRVLKGHLNFSIHFRKSLFSYEISEQGKVVNHLHKEDFLAPVDNMAQHSSQLSRSEAYLKDRGSKKKNEMIYSNFWNKEGEILVEYDMKNRSLRLLQFKHQDL